MGYRWDQAEARQRSEYGAHPYRRFCAMDSGADAPVPQRGRRRDDHEVRGVLLSIQVELRRREQDDRR